MKLLLCSDFYGIGIKYLNKFFDNTNEKTCLFIGYASEDDENMYKSRVKDKLFELGIKVKDLTPNFKNNCKIDMLYVRGGNATKLLHYLKKYNQFNLIKDLVENQDVLYIGQSAGALIAGNDTSWTLRSEPYDVDLKSLYGKDALNGFGWVSKMIFVHCSKYRLLWGEEQIDGSQNWRILNKEFYGDYLKDRKIYNKQDYVVLGNNQIIYQNGDIQTQKILTYDWSKIPFTKKQPQYM